MIQLNPCPFCGAKASFSRIPGQGLSILCSGCGAIAAKKADTSSQALADAWNARTVRHNFSRQSNVAPCPFCASRLDVGKMPDNASILKCMQCGMYVTFIESDDLHDTVVRWNRRAP